MTGIGDSFAWPFQDPGWLGKMVVQGLIAIIPILGWMALFGWLAFTMDNYRAGRRELAPAGFHLERGIGFFLASLGSLVSFGLSIFLAFLAPAIILNTYRSGINGGFDINAVWQTATANTSNTAVAAF